MHSRASDGGDGRGIGACNRRFLVCQFDDEWRELQLGTVVRGTMYFNAI